MSSQLSVVPAQIAAGSGDTRIKISGYGFTSKMQVQWNGQPRATQFVNDFLLKATITQADLAMPSLAEVTVVDSSTGVAVSGPVPTFVYLPIASNDLTYDSSRGKIYVSVSKQDPNGPSIAIVDTAQGIVDRYVPVPSEPGPLALTADSNYLYIGMADRIRRMDLTGRTPDADVPASAINATQSYSPPSATFRPQSLMALPNQDTSFVVTVDEGSGHYSAYVVDGTTIRPKHSNDPGRCLIGIPDGITIYGGPGLIETLLTDDGLPFSPSYESTSLAEGPTCPVYSNGLIYGSDGDVVDAVSHSRIRWLPAVGNLDVVPETSEVHFLNRIDGGNAGTVALRFDLFDGQSGSLLRSVPLGIQMSVANSDAPNGHLIHWGSDGIAFGDYSTLNSSVAKRLYMIRLARQ